MKISIIIPYFNALKTIEKTLFSVYTQTYNNYEVIVINDKSNDNPLPIINNYKLKFEKNNINLKYIEFNENKGPSKARNYAWDLSVGDYIAFLDADDFWHCKKLETCVNFLSISKPQMLIHSCEVFNGTSIDKIISNKYDFADFNIIKSNKYKWLLKNHSVTPSVILNQKITLRFSESMKYSEDYDLWLRIVFNYNNTIELKGPALTFLGKPFMVGNGLSSNIHKMRIGELKLYYNFCKKNKVFLILLPFLFLNSIFKHFKLLFKLI